MPSLVFKRNRLAFQIAHLKSKMFPYSQSSHKKVFLLNICRHGSHVRSNRTVIQQHASRNIHLADISLRQHIH